MFHSRRCGTHTTCHQCVPKEPAFHHHKSRQRKARRARQATETFPVLPGSDRSVEVTDMDALEPKDIKLPDPANLVPRTFLVENTDNVIATCAVRDCLEPGTTYTVSEMAGVCASCHAPFCPKHKKTGALRCDLCAPTMAEEGNRERSLESFSPGKREEMSLLNLIARNKGTRGRKAPSESRIDVMRWYPLGGSWIGLVYPVVLEW